MRVVTLSLAGLALAVSGLIATPAAAQCVYVACQNGQQQAPNPGPATSYYPDSSPSNAFDRDGGASYRQGYAAGRRDALRRSTSHKVHRPAAKAHKPASGSSAHKATQKRSHGVAARKHVATRPAAKRTIVKRRATSGYSMVRGEPDRRSAVASYSYAATQTFGEPDRRSYSSSYSSSGTYTRDNAATYGATQSGQGVNLGTVVGRGDRTVTTSGSRTVWVGPSNTVVRGGQVCGWGAQIVHTPHGPQRQSAWVCQCPQGWRPPGY